MHVLGIDTSGDVGSVAVLRDAALLAELSVHRPGRHGQALIPLVESALAYAGVDRGALQLISVGLGPGSFTGTRVGVATAKGLALALSVPIVGVPSLRALAEALSGPWVAPWVDAQKHEVYAALYQRGEDRLCERLAPFHAAPAEALTRLRAAAGHGPVTLGGSGLQRYPDAALAEGFVRVGAPAATPRAAWIAWLGLGRLKEHGPDDLAGLDVLYVRPSDAKPPTENAR